MKNGNPEDIWKAARLFIDPFSRQLAALAFIEATACQDAQLLQDSLTDACDVEDDWEPDDFYDDYDVPFEGRV